MTTPVRFLLALSATAILAACASNSPAYGPEPAAAGSASTTATATASAGLTDDRAKELGRSYAEQLQAKNFDALWRRSSPEVQQRFGTLDRFRASIEAGMAEFGNEIHLVSDQVEPAKAGMAASKLYSRTAHYSKAGNTAIRLAIGLKDDGTLAGIEVGKAE